LTQTDLDQLEDGYVLTADDDGHVQTMTYDDFVRQVRHNRGSCSRT
jgi:hypothetical protein